MRHLVRVMRTWPAKRHFRNVVKQKDKYKVLCMDLWLFKGCAVVFLISNFIATSAGCEATSGTHSCCIIQMPAYKMRIQVGSWVRGGLLSSQFTFQPATSWPPTNFPLRAPQLWYFKSFCISLSQNPTHAKCHLGQAFIKQFSDNGATAAAAAAAAALKY